MMQGANIKINYLATLLAEKKCSDTVTRNF